MTRPYLTQWLHQGARALPDQPVLIAGERETSNAELASTVSRLAGSLRELGVGSGDRVGIVALNSDRLVAMLFATIWAGAVPTPVNTRWSPKEMAAALDDCGAVALVVDETFASAVDELRSRVPSIRTVVQLDGIEADGEPVDDAMRGGDDIALILYTGGTTGRSKGVELTHQNLVSATLGMLAGQYGTGTTFLLAPPLFHVAGIQMLLTHLFGGGGPVVILPGFDPAAALEAIERHRVTSTMLVPTMLQMLLAHPRADASDLSSLERLFYGAAPMSDALLDAAMHALPGCHFVQGYGMTETGLTILGAHPDKRRSIGRPVPTAEVAVRDADGLEVGPGVVGEITVRGPSVMAGYHGLADLTAATIRDGWLHSGDGGYVDEDGDVYLVDRIKDMIITGGENVYSVEVESVLAGHPAVAMVAVIGLPHDTWGEQVHAVVVPAPDRAITDDDELVEDLIEHCRREIAAFKCPRSVDIVSELPLSAAGKILKTDLRAERGATR